MCADEVPVVARIEQEQGHARNVTVAQLEREPTLKGLTITRSRLGLNAMPPNRRP